MPMFKFDKQSYRAGVNRAVGVLMDEGKHELARKVIEETDIDAGKPRPDLVELLSDIDTKSGGSDGR